MTQRLNGSTSDDAETEFAAEARGVNLTGPEGAALLEIMSFGDKTYLFCRGHHHFDHTYAPLRTHSHSRNVRSGPVEFSDSLLQGHVKTGVLNDEIMALLVMAETRLAELDSVIASTFRAWCDNCHTFLSNRTARPAARIRLAECWSDMERLSDEVLHVHMALAEISAEIQAEPARFKSLVSKRTNKVRDIASKLIQQLTDVYGMLGTDVLRRTGVYFHNLCSRHEVEEWEIEQRFWDILYAHIDAFGNSMEALVVFEQSRRQATTEQLKLAHSEEYISSLVKQLGSVRHRYEWDDDTAVSKHTLKACRAAAGTALLAVDRVMTAQVLNAFCIIRPPGHHAGIDGRVGQSNSQGFCFVNNAALAAKYALSEYSDTVNHVAIVDFDVHHGDGTEEIANNDDRLYFFSIHAYDGQFYPMTGSHSNGNCVNVPMDLNFNTRAFLTAFRRSILPKLFACSPDLIVVSAGFDGRRGDSLTQPDRGGDNGLDPSGYYQLGLMLAEAALKICDGRLLSVLEGGYGDHILGACAVAHTKGLVDASIKNALLHINQQTIDEDQDEA